MKTKLIGPVVALAIAFALLGASPRAAATTLTGSQLIVNFDLTGASPAPPYTNILFSAVFAGSDPVTENVDTLLTYIYGDVDGVDLLQIRNDSDPGFSYGVAFSGGGTLYGPLFTANPLFDPMLDGIFSIGFAMPAGSADILSISVQGYGANGYSNTVTHTFPVPDEGAMWVEILGGLLLVALFTRFNFARHRLAARTR